MPSFDVSEKTAVARGAAALRAILALRAALAGKALAFWILALRETPALRGCWAGAIAVLAPKVPTRVRGAAARFTESDWFLSVRCVPTDGVRGFCGDSPFATNTTDNKQQRASNAFLISCDIFYRFLKI